MKGNEVSVETKTTQEIKPEELPPPLPSNSTHPLSPPLNPHVIQFHKTQREKQLPPDRLQAMSYHDREREEVGIPRSVSQQCAVALCSHGESSSYFLTPNCENLHVFPPGKCQVPQAEERSGLFSVRGKAKQTWCVVCVWCVWCVVCMCVWCVCVWVGVVCVFSVQRVREICCRNCSYSNKPRRKSVGILLQANCTQMIGCDLVQLRDDVVHFEGNYCFCLQDRRVNNT